MLFAYVDDIYVLCDLDRVAEIFLQVRHALHHAAGIQVNLGLVELSQVEFLDLSQTNDLENICKELFSFIERKFRIEDDQILSDHVWFEFQWTRENLCWFVPFSLSGSVMCEAGFAGDDALYVLFPSIEDNPVTPGTMDRKDSNVGVGTGVSSGGCAHSSHDIGVHH